MNKVCVHRLNISRVISKDRLENCGFCGEGVEIVEEVVVDPQRQIHHFHGLGDHLRAATEPREKMTNVVVVRDGQVFAREELALRNEAVITLPIIGDERLAFHISSSVTTTTSARKLPEPSTNDSDFGVTVEGVRAAVAVIYPAPNWGATMGAVLLGVVTSIAMLGGLHLWLFGVSPIAM